MANGDYELVVVGGGPAGAAAALAGVERGLKTLILERKKMPRFKPCAGYIFQEASAFLQKHYGPIPDEVRSSPHRVKAVRILTGKGLLLEVPIGGESVWRDRFDEWLCRRSGAEVRDGATLVDFAEWKNRVELRCRWDGKEIKLRAAALVAADGGVSPVARKLDPAFGRGVPHIATRHEYHRADVELEPGYFYVFVDPAYGVYPALYFKDDLVVTDTSVRKGRKIEPTRREFHSMLAREFGFRSREVALVLGCQSLFPAALNRFCLGTGRVLVAGEGAGFMNALGEGISSALSTGYLAGRAAAECGRSLPGNIYRELVLPERERTAREWSLPDMISGKVKPEFREALFRLGALGLFKATRAILSWQRGGGVAPGLDRDSVEVLLRRLLHRGYDFRA